MTKRFLILGLLHSRSRRPDASRRSFMSLHVPALALVGWYLMVPPATGPSG